MVAALIRMKVAIARNSATGERRTWALTGTLVGLVLAAGTVWLAQSAETGSTASRDLLCLAIAMWVLGWAIAPVWAGEPVLQARHFSMLAIPRRILAVGLLASNLVSIPGLITAAALSSVVVLGAPSGWAAALVAVAALALQLGMAVLLLRLAAHWFSRLAQSRLGAAVTGALTGVLLVLTQAGWMILVVLDIVRTTGFSRVVSIGIQVFPSSWGVLAVEAAADERAVAAGWWLAALTVFDALLLLSWTRALGARPANRLVIRGSARHRPVTNGRIHGWPGPAVWAALRRERAAWWREPARLQAVAASVVFAIITCALPLAAGSTVLLPWMGCFAVAILAAMTANPYGQDGTSLWLTIQIPGALRADLWARQLSWTIVAALIAAPLTIAGWLWSRATYPDLWAGIGATVATLVSAAAVAHIGVSALAPGPDPRTARDRPLDHADVTGQSFAVIALVAVAMTPLALISIIDLPPQLSSPAGTAVLAVIVLGYAAILWWVVGAAAGARLEKRAPELLLTMRAGRSPAAIRGGHQVMSLPRWRQTVLWGSIIAACIAMFPQALVPAAMKATGNVERLWFLALYAPGPWQWTVITAMSLLALGLGFTAYRIYRSAPAGPPHASSAPDISGSRS
jgi:hypothetical protein